jgi:hypothetical protein
MIQESVELLIPFESLVKSITKRCKKDKIRLWELLHEQMAHAEEKTWEKDPSVQSEW